MKLGVWTLEKEGKKPDVNVSFEDSRPSFSHYALVYLNRISKLEFKFRKNKLIKKKAVKINFIIHLDSNFV